MQAHHTRGWLESNRIRGIRLREDALPGPLFERLVRAVRSTGSERLKGTYTTTFWFPREAKPTNIAEESIVRLLQLVEPGSECIGIEWWLGRLRYGKKLGFHFDKDLTVRKETRQYIHPLLSSALYLNAFPSSPMIILDQVPGPDGESRVPEEPQHSEAVEPFPNRYVVFPGNLRHGVIPTAEAATRAGNDADGGASAELRLSLLVNFWQRRPMPPVCLDYDGTIYPSLRLETGDALSTARE
jgi:hypothetical protein